MTRRPAAGKQAETSSPVAAAKAAPKVGASRLARPSTKPRNRSAPPFPAPAVSSGMGLHTADGARKYLTAGERDAFLREAELADRQVRTLCLTLAYAGCRLSEALALTIDRVDLAAGVLTVESLKKRRTGIYRAVPVPPTVLAALDMVHGVRELQVRRGRGREVACGPGAA